MKFTLPQLIVAICIATGIGHYFGHQLGQAECLVRQEKPK